MLIRPTLHLAEREQTLHQEATLRLGRGLHFRLRLSHAVCPTRRFRAAQRTVRCNRLLDRSRA